MVECFKAFVIKHNIAIEHENGVIIATYKKNQNTDAKVFSSPFADKLFDQICTHIGRDNFIINASGKNLKLMCLSDLEGSLEKLKAALNNRDTNPHGITLDETNEVLNIPKDTIYIDNGDRWDKNSFDETISRIFENTHRRYQHEDQQRIFMTIGNRDVNKLRISEISKIGIMHRILHNDMPAWMNTLTFAAQILEDLVSSPNSLATIDQNFKDVTNCFSETDSASFNKLKSMDPRSRMNDLNKLTLENPGVRKELAKLVEKIYEDASKDTQQDSSAKHKLHLLEFKYLNWMINNTMGCASDGFFDSSINSRRVEIARRNNIDISKVSDEVLLDAYKKSIEPGGYVRENLLRALPGVLLDMGTDKVVFVHGGFNEKTLIEQGIDYSERNICDLMRSINKNYFESQDAAIAMIDDKNSKNRELPFTVFRCFTFGIEIGRHHVLLSGERLYEDWQIEKIKEAITFDKTGSYVVENETLTNREVSNNTVEERKEPYLHKDVAKFLTANKVRTLVVGHQPYGDSYKGHVFAVPESNVVVVDIDNCRALEQPNMNNQNQAASACVFIADILNGKYSAKQVAVVPYLGEKGKYSVHTIKATEHPLEIGSNDIGFTQGLYTVARGSVKTISANKETIEMANVVMLSLRTNDPSTPWLKGTKSHEYVLRSDTYKTFLPLFVSKCTSNDKSTTSLDNKEIKRARLAL